MTKSRLEASAIIKELPPQHQPTVSGCVPPAMAISIINQSINQPTIQSCSRIDCHNSVMETV